MFEFIFGEKKGPKKEKELKKEKFVKVPLRKKCMYLVVDKNSMQPLGIFDNLEDAKTNGQKITYHNCMIIPFDINEPCKYLIDPVFESK